MSCLKDAFVEPTCLPPPQNTVANFRGISSFSRSFLPRYQKHLLAAQQLQQPWPMKWARKGQEHELLVYLWVHGTHLSSEPDHDVLMSCLQEVTYFCTPPERECPKIHPAREPALSEAGGCKIARQAELSESCVGTKCEPNLSACLASPEHSFDAVKCQTIILGSSNFWTPQVM